MPWAAMRTRRPSRIASPLGTSPISSASTEKRTKTSWNTSLKGRPAAAIYGGDQPELGDPADLHAAVAHRRAGIETLHRFAE